MPPKPFVDKADVLTAAASLIRTSGYENLNARSLAQALGRSTKPVFRVFQNMEELKFSVLVYLSKEVWDAISTENSYLDFVKNYIRLAKDESNIFKALFMSGAVSQEMISEMLSAKDIQHYIIGISQLEGISLLQAQKIYLSIWFLAHGLACMLSANKNAMHLQQADEIVSEAYHKYIVTARLENT